MSILNPPANVVLIIQRQVTTDDVTTGRAKPNVRLGRVWVDCSNGRLKGYSADEEAACIEDLQVMSEKFPEHNYRVLRTVEYVKPQKAALKAR
ncbi:hypothetical protein [Pseudomonas phage Pf17397_F_PD1]|nr:hypothetical protein [Pseudomonas phage Pf17397_F_PD1]